MLLTNQSRFSTSPSPAALDPADPPTEVTNTNDIFDDVFSSSPPHSSHVTHTSDQNAETEDLSEELRLSRLQERSDIPRLQSQHSTAGYREGIASSKALFVQEGFDEGYMLGAELGGRGGWCLGVLEGVVRALAGGGGGKDEELERCKSLLGDARRDLSVKGLYDLVYFGQDGIWKYEVGTGQKRPGATSESGKDAEEDEELDFRKVASAHPLIKKWMDILETLAKELGLDLETLKDKDVAAGD